MSRFASRKFVAALLALASSHWLRASGLIDSDDYVHVTLGTVGVYVTGNVWQAVMSKAAP